MIHGKKIVVSQQGFHIDSKLLQSIGIHDKSRCRGIFIHNNKGEYSKKNRDLIISPFPFASWACMVKLQIRIKHDKGINKTLKILSEEGFNILSANLIFSGYKHQTLEIFGEIFELRDCAKKIRQTTENHDLKIKFRIKLYNKIHILHKLIKEKCREDLYTSSDDNIELGYIETHIKELNKENEIIINKEAFLETDNRQKIKPIHWKWLKKLALNAFNTSDGEETLYFNYNSEKSLLALEKKDINKNFLRNFSDNEYKLPLLALTEFNSDNGYIKLRSFSQLTYNKEILQFDFTYSIKLINSDILKNKESTAINEINEYGSRGIILDLLNAIKKEMSIKDQDKLDLTGISIKNLSRGSLTEEEGHISIHGIFKTETKNGFQLDTLKKIQDKICYIIYNNERYPTNQMFYDLEMKIKKISPYTIFISVRENFKNRIAYNLHNILQQEGFNAKTSGTYTDEITENVIQDMSACDACIQIYSLSYDEINRIKRDGECANFVPDNSWLLFEFGIARAKDIPIVRMIDVTHLDKKQWVQYLRTDNDKLLIEFNTISKKMYLKNKIREATQHLLKTLEKK